VHRPALLPLRQIGLKKARSKSAVAVNALLVQPARNDHRQGAEAPDYDRDEYPSDTQREWVVRLVQRPPANALVLDHAVRRGVVDVDQSAGVLAQARARGIALSLDDDQIAVIDMLCLLLGYGQRPKPTTGLPLQPCTCQ
jgi:hypothetical protein